MTNEKVDIAIIGGTGVYDPGLLTGAKRIKVYTPFGAPTDLITIGNYGGIKIAFLPRHGRDHHYKGTIVTIQGPRYSTRAESVYFRDAVKADIIGMTLVTECQLARELEICYLSIAAVTDYDSWSEEPVVASMVLKTMETNLGILRQLLIELLPKISSSRRDKCNCAYALKDAGH